ncbi:hypothetical protein [Halorubrum kocurii]|uniref:Uncharacterized protein n=1 Tax=Halorubrum kocurii JCM 14978 TaxID=1230456 RepID=M0PAN1_9EURY|nr:hypothetical protein [Halorubrum kocurii]EMA67066.1 hypothetical protein C468_03373 [Halorubrum kocurii JCM 14978]
MGVGSTVELAFRFGVAAVAIVGPTVLYLGLWRFLAWLRDDALVDRLAARGAVEAPRPAPADVLASATAGLDGRRCPACGTRLIAGETRCRSCHRDPDDGTGRADGGTAPTDAENPSVGRRR